MPRFEERVAEGAFAQGDSHICRDCGDRGWPAWSGGLCPDCERKHDRMLFAARERKEQREHDAAMARAEQELAK